MIFNSVNDTIHLCNSGGGDPTKQNQKQILAENKNQTYAERLERKIFIWNRELSNYYFCLSKIHPSAISPSKINCPEMDLQALPLPQEINSD